MKRLVYSSTDKPRNYYLLAILNALDLTYEPGYEVEQQTRYGRLLYRVKRKGGRYFLDVWMDDKQLDECLDAAKKTIVDLGLSSGPYVKGHPRVKDTYIVVEEPLKGHYCITIRDIPAVTEE